MSDLYDLVLIVDATASMGPYLRALNDSLPQILALSELTSAFESVGVIAYRDYGERHDQIVEWSGWYKSGSDCKELFKFARELEPIGGEDFPEATRSGLSKLLDNLNPDRKILCLMYTDAPPHSPEARSWGGNMEKEQKALKGTKCVDWISCCKALRENNVQVLTLLDRGMNIYESFYVPLGRITGGTTVVFKEEPKSRDISLATMELLLAFLDQHRDTHTDLVETITYKDLTGFDDLKSEKDHHGFLTQGGNACTKGIKHVNFSEKHVRRRHGEVFDFSQRFQSDPEYRQTVYKSLTNIVEMDVTAISLNPVFAELWRVVCKEKGAEERTALVNAFSAAVGKLPAGASRDDMTRWLEESYDSTKDIEEIIEKVDPADIYPAICIDPTDLRETWVRSELLEVGRSCYAGVLKRLGNIMAKHLVFVETEDSLPHLRDVPKLPLALAKKGAFWKLLLHLVLPGTLLTTRAGNVLAALALKLGIPFLRQPAEESLLMWKGKWADLETPENFAVDLMQLMTSVGYLSETEEKVFRNLVDYKFAEKNLETELTARIPFTPEKTVGWVGPTEQCRTCKYQRSVTMMGRGGRCGICLWAPTDGPGKEKKKELVHVRAEEKELAWVECGQSDCRAAYCIYDTAALNVKPKCHYHRFPEPTLKECPWVECKKCKNRVIWPEEYRDGREKDFECVFCQEGRESIVGVQTTAKALIKENGTEWILGKKMDFLGRSAFAVVKNEGIEAITELKILQSGPKTLKHKPIHNPDDVKEQLARWVREGRVEDKLCNLCFEQHKPQDLLPACGRKGCLNRVDNDCLKEWYGVNKPGSVIHTNSLGCPFCRRFPSAKVLAKYSSIWSLGNLKDAIDSRGWIYGWCVTCATAKKVMERVCTGGGTPPELTGWTCEDCSGSNALVAKAKKCPGCGIPTEKSGGCNHIYCSVKDCGIHWCWTCTGAFDEYVIYEHMEEQHGGIYGVYE